MPADPAGRRATLGPVVLLGLGSAGVAALSGTKVWVAHDLTLKGTPGGPSLVGADPGAFPLSGGLGLLLLAIWGVLLLTRGRLRRAVAAVAVLVSLGLVACAVYGGVRLPDDVRQRFSGPQSRGFRLEVHHTGWYWTAAVVCLVALSAALLAVLLTPHWPKRGVGYDPGVAGDERPPHARRWKRRG